MFPRIQINSAIDTLGAAHVAAALASLAFGALVLGMRKGTQLHRAMGISYAMAMIVLNATALRCIGSPGISAHFMCWRC